MIDSSLVTMGWVVSNYLIAGVEPTPNGNDNFTAAPSGTFRTGGRAAEHRREQAGAVRGAGVGAIGRADLATDARFAKRESRKRNRAALTVEIEASLQQRPAAEWETIFNGLGIPAGRVVSRARGARAANS